MEKPPVMEPKSMFRGIRSVRDNRVDGRLKRDMRHGGQ